MNLPKAFAILGNAIAMTIEYDGYLYEHTWPEKGPDRMILLAGSAKGAAVYPHGHCLLLVKPRGTTRLKANDSKMEHDTLLNAVRVYERFNDRKAVAIEKMTLPNYKYKRFGKVRSITYFSYKWGKQGRYIHKFENLTYARINKTNNGMNPPVILVTGNKLLVTKRGIEG